VKLVFVGGTCHFCEYIRDNYPQAWVPEMDDNFLVRGRTYTLETKFKVTLDGIVGYGIRLRELTLPANHGHCSCMFREIEGDDDAWRRIMEENRPKTKELEPV
jgi:hypothetical protein